MLKNKHFTFKFLFIICLCMQYSSITAQKIYLNQEPTNENAFILQDSYIESTELGSSRIFKLELQENVDCRIGFYARGYKLPDEKFSTYKININNTYIDSLEMTSCQWQEYNLKNSPGIKLYAGENTITIIDNSPLIPEVDALIITFPKRSNKSPLINSQLYNEHIDYNNTEDYNTVGEMLIDSYATPLKYSYNLDCNFEEGDVISISGGGYVPHAIDLFYVGCNNEDNSFTYATQYEASVLNWHGDCALEYGNATLDSYNIALAEGRDMLFHSWIRVKIPKTGTYKLRAYHLIEGKEGEIEININNHYIYEESKIYGSLHRCPKNFLKGQYEVKAKCSRSTIFPLIFIRQSEGQRIIAYENRMYTESPQERYTKLSLTNTVPFNGIHVSSPTALYSNLTASVFIYKKDDTSIDKILDRNILNKSLQHNSYTSDQTEMENELNSLNNILTDVLIFNEKGILLKQLKTSEEITSKNIDNYTESKGVLYIVTFKDNKMKTNKIIK